MSGRSAFVRKQKTKVKDGQFMLHDDNSEHRSNPSPGDFPMPVSNQTFQFPVELQAAPRSSTNERAATIKTQESSRSDDPSYARVRKPKTPVIDVSGIEKSEFRVAMEKKSDGVRKMLSKSFGRKKKRDEDSRPVTAATMRPQASSVQEEEEFDACPPPSIPRHRQPQLNHQASSPQLDQYRPADIKNETHERSRPGPPQGDLPPIPQGPQMKRWVGNGKPAQTWSKLRRDPELWHNNGDTLVFFGPASMRSRLKPSFRIHSRIIFDTDSEFLVDLLHDGAIEDGSGFSMPPSPTSVPDSRQYFSPHRFRSGPTPPISEGSIIGSAGGYEEGQIAFEMFFPVPSGKPKAEVVRYQMTVRNVFAFLTGASLVGFNFFHALVDLHDRLDTYMPHDYDTSGKIVDYVSEMGLDDVRENPNHACALIAYSEQSSVRWQEGFREAFVHCSGFFTRAEECDNFKFIAPYTRAILGRASLDMQIRVHDVEARLSNFSFADMWPMMDPSPPPAQAAFERLKMFFFQHYQNAYGEWPPPAPAGYDHWLTRLLAKKLSADFGALYDYLVNREVTWDGPNDRAGRKWDIVCSDNPSFKADTPDLPFTDLLVAFDNRLGYPHIPHPYPLVPDRVQVPNISPNKPNSSAHDRLAERKAALAYTESTNIYLLGSNFASNDLVEDFVKFEKNDRAGNIDPYSARRGRWVLIYGVLQVLASVSVDTPGLRYTDDVQYHLSPPLNGLVPWKPRGSSWESASHIGSHCWIARHKWNPEPPFTLMRPPQQSRTHLKAGPRLPATSYNELDAEPTRSNTMQSLRSNPRRAGPGSVRARDITTSDNLSYSGYAPGIEKLGDYPLTEDDNFGSARKLQIRSRSRTALNKDYGDEESQSQSRATSRTGSLRDRGLDHSAQTRSGSMHDRGIDGGQSRNESRSGSLLDQITESTHNINTSLRDREPGRSRMRSDSSGGSLRDASQSQNGSARDRREQVQMNRDYTIKDFEGYNFRDGTGSLGVGEQWKMEPRRD